MKPLKRNGIPIKPYFLYDALGDGGSPLAVPSYGYKAVIIDHEYAYVSTLEGYPVDCPLGLLHRHMDPTCSDKSIDVLRFLMSVFSFYHSKHKSQFIEKLIQQVYILYSKYDIF